MRSSSARSGRHTCSSWRVLETSKVVLTSKFSACNVPIKASCRGPRSSTRRSRRLVSTRPSSVRSLTDPYVMSANAHRPCNGRQCEVLVPRLTLHSPKSPFEEPRLKDPRACGTSSLWTSHGEATGSARNRRSMLCWSTQCCSAPLAPSRGRGRRHRRRLLRQKPPPSSPCRRAYS